MTLVRKYDVWISENKIVILHRQNELYYEQEERKTIKRLV